jgi:hypothetical protein
MQENVKIVRAALAALVRRSDWEARLCLAQAGVAVDQLDRS